VQPLPNIPQPYGQVHKTPTQHQRHNPEKQPDYCRKMLYNALLDLNPDYETRLLINRLVSGNLEKHELFFYYNELAELSGSSRDPHLSYAVFQTLYNILHHANSEPTSKQCVLLARVAEARMNNALKLLKMNRAMISALRGLDDFSLLLNHHFGNCER